MASRSSARGCAAASKRCHAVAELQLRAKALSLLVERLETKRQALTAKLQAPLQARLDHYMRLLFPGARLGLQEDLTPAVLERGVGTDAVDFGQLSHGAREQIALISRLAYADLLKEAGKPTLILLVPRTRQHRQPAARSDVARAVRRSAAASDAAVHLPSGALGWPWGSGARGRRFCQARRSSQAGITRGLNRSTSDAGDVGLAPKKTCFIADDQIAEMEHER